MSRHAALGRGTRFVPARFRVAARMRELAADSTLTPEERQTTLRAFVASLAEDFVPLAAPVSNDLNVSGSQLLPRAGAGTNVGGGRDGDPLACCAGDVAGGVSPRWFAALSIPRLLARSHPLARVPLRFASSVAPFGMLAGRAGEVCLGAVLAAATINAAEDSLRLTPPGSASASGRPPDVVGAKGDTVIAEGDSADASGAAALGADAAAQVSSGDVRTLPHQPSVVPGAESSEDGDAIIASGAGAGVDAANSAVALGADGAARLYPSSGDSPTVRHLVVPGAKGSEDDNKIIASGAGAGFHAVNGAVALGADGAAKAYSGNRNDPTVHQLVVPGASGDVIIASEARAGVDTAFNAEIPSAGSATRASSTDGKTLPFRQSIASYVKDAKVDDVIIASGARAAVDIANGAAALGSGAAVLAPT